LARAELDLDRAQGQPERQHVAADDFQRRLHQVVALLGQILIAVREEADGRRPARLAGILRRHVGVVELEEMEFDLEACDEIVAARAKLLQHGAIKVTRCERHQPPVIEIDVAEQPARGRRPGQHAERGGIGDHQHVGRAFHLLHAEPAAGGEHREHGLVRSVLRQHRRGDGAAAFERVHRFARDQRLAAQNAVLVRKRQPDNFQILLVDDAAKAARRLLLLG
jgi:hypothetical protein